jgi:hypothetical protein
MPRVSHLAALTALAVLSAAPAFANGPTSTGSTGATTSTAAPPPDYLTPGARHGSAAAGGGNRGRMVRDYDYNSHRATGSGYDYRPRLRDAHFLHDDVVGDRYEPRKRDATRDYKVHGYLHGLGLR